MKTLLTHDIDGIEVIHCIGRPSINPVATERAIKAAGHKITSKNRRELFKRYAVYFKSTAREEIVADEVAEEYLYKMTDGVVVTKSLEVIPDNRGKIIFKKSSGEAVQCRSIKIPEDCTSEEPPDGKCIYKYNKGWKVDSTLKDERNFLEAKAEEESEIQAEIRAMAIERIASKK